ncbi:MAG: hypothetical protein ASARMPRED_005109 [Alectoria sarmentosa]|nr:MAG: hypothetical protein ASARMPRED_005109 [Alectoria sarmentosa]
MYLTHSLALALPALAAAQNIQKPLIEQAGDWLYSIRDYIATNVPTTMPAVPTAVKSPVAASAAKIAALKVTSLTMDNYESELTPDPNSAKSPQEWMVFISGGNKTCGGVCDRLEREWNETASVLAADPTAPNLAYVNCDKQGVLCSTWMAKPPTLWHIQRPVAQADQSTPASTIHINYFNVTHSTVGDMVAIHSGKKYEEGILYEGWFDPFDGQLAKLGVNKAVGYALFGIGMVPSWAFMIVISMVSRTIIARRNGPNPAVQRQEAERRAAGGNAPLGGAPPANE